MKYIVGLGNPGAEYEKTRHNTGRIIISFIEDKIETKVKFVMPDSFMNNSGKVVAPLIKSKKDLADLVVIYDDIDLPLGKMKISFNRSSGGHNGVGSIIKHLKTEEFVRIRVGICPTTPAGKLKKPKGEEAILKFLLGEFKKEEIAELKKLSKKIAEAIDTFYSDGLGKAMSLYN
jgi:PTH1 family peptidyl-tRNA hydrolase